MKGAVAFKHYSVEMRDGERIVYAWLPDGEAAKMGPSCDISEDHLWVSLYNLYMRTKGKSDDEVSNTIVEWCESHVHPYYLWDMDTDTNYRSTGSDDLLYFEFPMKRMRTDLEKIYRDTHMVMMFKRLIEGAEVERDIKRITWTKKYVNIIEMNHDDQLEEIVTYMNQLPKFKMGLALDKDGEFMVRPEFHSVFEAAYFALSRYVAGPRDYSHDYGDRVGICECCEGLFIKNGNRQKYCDHPECKKERNRRKSKMAYHRRQKEDKNAEWAQEKMEESRND